uniref:Uncharacterized protein n=1 Tax=Aegilops tauschii subsp. strangulata TaxID=200361 RepID=A0A453SZW6_AEGTS
MGYRCTGVGEGAWNPKMHPRDRDRLLSICLPQTDPIPGILGWSCLHASWHIRRAERASSETLGPACFPADAPNAASLHLPVTRQTNRRYARHSSSAPIDRFTLPTFFDKQTKRAPTLLLFFPNATLVIPAIFVLLGKIGHKNLMCHALVHWSCLWCPSMDGFYHEIALTVFCHETALRTIFFSYDFVRQDTGPFLTFGPTTPEQSARTHNRMKFDRTYSSPLLVIVSE